MKQERTAALMIHQCFSFQVMSMATFSTTREPISLQWRRQGMVRALSVGGNRVRPQVEPGKGLARES